MPDDYLTLAEVRGGFKLEERAESERTSREPRRDAERREPGAESRTAPSTEL